MKRLSYFAALFIGIIIFGIVLWQTGLNNVIETIKLIPISRLLLVSLIIFFVQILHTIKWMIIIRANGNRISFLKLLKIRLAGYYAGRLIPSANLGGEPVRILILSKKSGIPIDKNTASVIVDKSIELSVSFFFLLFSFLFLLMRYELEQRTMFLLLGAVVFLFAVFLLFYYMTLRNKGFFSSLISFFRIDRIGYVKGIKGALQRTEKEVSGFLCHKKAAYFVSLIVTFASYLAFAYVYIIILSAIGYDASIAEAIMIVVLSSFSFAFPIPAGFGAYELAMVGIFAVLGIGADAGLAFSLVVRVAEGIVLGIGAFMLSHLGIELTAGAIEKKAGRAGRSFNSKKKKH